MEVKSRYPGARPFERDQSGIFFGRDQDTVNLHRLIKLENLIVLHGKSGMGKSSLLNAGVLPRLMEEDRFEPVTIRFSAWNQALGGRLPLEATIDAIRKGGQSANTFLDKIIRDENSLWHDMTERYIQQNGKRGMLLIFDQFEELFTYPEESVLAFKKHLAEALYVSVPQRYWDVLETAYESGVSLLSKEEATLFQESAGLKVVVAVRSDRMHQLNRLTDYLPKLLKDCYVLDALTEEQATQAILKPAEMDGEFISPRFTFDQAAIDKILAFLTDEHNGKIESTQLQIVCHSIEQKVIHQKIQVVTSDHLGDLKHIIVNYYDEIMNAIEPEEQRDNARRLVEEGLIFEKDEIRLSLFEGQIEDTYKVTPDTLRKLVNSHLLRSEEREKGKYIYELSHDTLVGPVLQAKSWRLMQERAEKEVLVTQERERILEEERKKTQRANTRALVSTALTIIALVSCALAVVGLTQAKSEKAKTEAALYRANKIAEDLEVAKSDIERKASEVQKSYDDLNKERLKRQEVESRTVLENVKSYLRAGFKEDARKELEKLKKMENLPADLRAEIDKIKNKINF